MVVVSLYSKYSTLVTGTTDLLSSELKTKHIIGKHRKSHTCNKSLCTMLCTNIRSNIRRGRGSLLKPIQIYSNIFGNWSEYLIKMNVSTGILPLLWRLKVGCKVDTRSKTVQII